MKARYSLMLFSLMFAGACAFFGIWEFNLSRRSSAQPEELTLAELVKRHSNERLQHRSASNPNVVITDFKIVAPYAVETKGLTQRWVKVWVPIVPADTPDDRVADSIAAILFSSSIKNEQELVERFDRPKLQGLIDPQSAEPGIKATFSWKREFPTLDLDRCVIIVEGKQPAGILKLGALGFGFVFFLLLTGGVWYLARKIDQMPEPTSASDTPIAPEIIE